MFSMRLSPGRRYHKGLLRAGIARQDGQTLVEFAIALGIFLATIVGIIIVCLALFDYEYVNFASREAARWAAVRGSECWLSSHTMPGCSSASGASATDIQNYVQNLGYPLIDTSKLTASNVTVNWYSLVPEVDSSGNYYATWPAPACVVASPPTGTECNQPGNAVQVSISYPFSFGISIPFVGSFTPTVSSSSQTIISQ